VSTFLEAAPDAIPLHAVAVEEFDNWLSGRTETERQWLNATGFKAKDGAVTTLPSSDGGLGGAVVCLGEGGPFGYAAAAEKLPGGAYRLAVKPDAAVANDAALGWGLAGYRFERYKQDDGEAANLVWPEACDQGRTEAALDAIYLARDLVNTTAADLGPAELAAAARGVAEKFGADFSEIVGDDLLDADYPMVHAVGRASSRPPRLIDMTWGEKGAPRVTLVGKGVCFDSGGLDLKPASAMELMKKDMGGSAAVLALASMVMAAGLPVRLRVLIPAVENAVSANAFRPGDVLQSRKGLTVEIGNTDAEGRLVLADALAEAASEDPELLIDCATLTGAARVALGPELPAFFTPDDDLARELGQAGEAVHDPVWRLPLWQPYTDLFKSRIADLNNAGEDRLGGAITAALFLERFAEGVDAWVHLDMFAWNKKARPGRPVGGEAQAVRALFHVIEGRFSNTT